MIIHLGHLPDRDLSPNKRLHHMAFYHAKNIAKEESHLRVLEQGRPRVPMPQAHITITWVAKDKRRRDIDNLFASMKPYIDGLVAASVIADDSADHVTYSLRYERGEKDDTIIEINEEVR
jgi:crossover junction endodeoxyribonuclease RusA